MIIAQSLKKIWKKKQMLRVVGPGHIIATTTFEIIHVYLVKRGWGDKWDQIGDQLKFYRRIIEETLDFKN
ncbi:hypothetical protein GCM10011511_11620 [Puia dinghuensis]|uniref:Uncharacterized protein n=2 Tax=Puia dinghuensis TaxID=1792502 RepID=A0A8J2XQ03_9BACT|nr:hypothetical protein GCM10011511_11620 [Puia dinghuensis]